MFIIVLVESSICKKRQESADPICKPAGKFSYRQVGIEYSAQTQYGKRYPGHLCFDSDVAANDDLQYIDKWNLKLRHQGAAVAWTDLFL